MAKIKKISVNKNTELFEIPGAKFRVPGCVWGDCHLQCQQSCNYGYDHGDTYELARDYYIDHHDIWN